ncbi:MAG: hypothetical protein M1834_002233 [Cirrosporium novae-zelandiae]|nr:MAG: hypothetical protein M1834_002233 [Cirrosporium novae-zelandiae]
MAAATSCGDANLAETQTGHKDPKESNQSQTALEYIDNQLQLEAEAREALPYSFDTCTKPLGPLRQILYSCLTCNPPPDSPSKPYNPAGVCYSCSISCHGEHTLVELFNKRNFVCDCGTTRMPATSCCTLRVNAATGLKGGVHSEEPAPGNRYNRNFQNRFCGCGEEYDANAEKGTMFQCLGLGTADDGGCGEDWWHPECLVGLPRGWYNDITQSEKDQVKKVAGGRARDETSLKPHGDAPASDANSNNQTSNKHEPNPHQCDGHHSHDHSDHHSIISDDEPPFPPGFPNEDDFEAFICYKCVEAHPWIKRYASTTGFLPPIFHKPLNTNQQENKDSSNLLAPPSKKRKLSNASETTVSDTSKRHKTASPDPPTTTSDPLPSTTLTSPTQPCKYTILPPPLSDQTPFSLFYLPDFRTHLCHCPACFPLLSPHPQLLEEEETYEPPMSDSSSVARNNNNDPLHAHVHSTTHSRGGSSLLDRGEAALSNIDRVRAIEGVMAYNHLRDKVKDFLKPFAESGQAVGAEDIKKYFEGLRGDAEAIRMAASGGASGDGDGRGGDDRKESEGGGGSGDGQQDSRREQRGF